VLPPGTGIGTHTVRSNLHKLISSLTSFPPQSFILSPNLLYLPAFFGTVHSIAYQSTTDKPRGNSQATLGEQQPTQDY